MEHRYAQRSRACILSVIGRGGVRPVEGSTQQLVELSWGKSIGKNSGNFSRWALLLVHYQFVATRPRLVATEVENQRAPASFAHAVHYLIDALDVASFDGNHNDDANSATAQAPPMLLKAVLRAFSQRDLQRFGNGMKPISPCAES